MTGQLALDVAAPVSGQVLADPDLEHCPYCGHRDGLHSGPGAPGPDAVPGACHECDSCPGWHPTLEPTRCGGCRRTDGDWLMVVGFREWQCADCLGWWPRNRHDDRVLAVAFGEVPA